MRLTIVGSGTVVPDGARNSSGYFIETEDVRLLLDCGAGTMHALARYRLPWERLTHLFVSHFHIDHAGELGALFMAFKYGMRVRRREPFTLIGPQGLDRVLQGLEEAFGQGLFETDFPVTVRMVTPGARLQLGAGTFLSVAKTPHTDESLAARVESHGATVCYTGDTRYSPDLARFFAGADVLISECSFRERREDIAHLAIQDVATIAADAGVRTLIPTHFYFDVDEGELTGALRRGFAGDIRVARDGMSLDVKSPEGPMR